MLLGILFLTASFVKHAFHTSVTEMNYNAKEKTMEVSIRIFTDDLESVLSSESGKKITIKDNDKNEVLIEKYLRKHFMVTSSKRQIINYSFLGKEQQKDATWLYLEMPLNVSFNGSTIKNDLLVDAFSDQVNIINISINGEKKTLLFNQKSRINKFN